MTSKLRKAIGAVKDQTSISLAKVSSNNTANLEVAILKATTHEKTPIEEKYVNEILQLIASNKVYAAACAYVIAKRIGKTRNWIVALKCLILVLKIFQDGDPYFPKEVRHATKRGAKMLNLSKFRDDSNTPLDYTEFVRTFALYLDERLDCFITGKLQKRYTNRNSKSLVCDMKPAMLLDKISYWQRLLDRAIVTRPTGVAKTNKLVQICLHAIVQETFDLYRDISDGLAFLLDSFFQLQYQYSVIALQSCLKANKQFDELSNFYNMCKIIGIGISSEYPSVQKISEEILDSLEESLKQQASLPENISSSLALPPKPPDLKTSHSGCSSVSFESNENCESNGKFSEKGSEYSSACTSLEDLMNSTDFGTSPSHFLYSDQDDFSEQFDKLSQRRDSNASTAASTGFSSPSPINQPGYSASDLAPFGDWKENKQEQNAKAQPAYRAPEFASFDDWPRNEDESDNNIAQEQKQTARSSDQPAYPAPNFTSFEECPDWVNENNEKKQEQFGKASELMPETSQSNSSDLWELVLAETATQQSSQSSSHNLSNGFHPFTEETVFDNPHMPQHYNPFLDMETELSATNYTTSSLDQPTYSASPTEKVQFPSDMFSTIPAFQAIPTFCVQSPSQGTVALQDDPFATEVCENDKLSGNVDQQGLLSEQQLWLQNQNKIIRKHLS